MNNRLINYTAFAILTLLWLGFGAALVLNQELLLTTWQLFRGWPLLAQIIVALLTMPVVIGLWVWQTAWPLWLRLILVIGLAWVTLYTFFPWKQKQQAEAPSEKA